MKYTKLILSGILFLAAFAFVKAQDTMYVMQNGTATQFPVAAVDSIIFYAPPTGGGGGGGTGTPANLGCTVGTKMADTNVSSTLYSNNFSTFSGNYNITNNMVNIGGSGSAVVLTSGNWGGDATATLTGGNGTMTITPTGVQNFGYDIAIAINTSFNQGQTYTMSFDASSTSPKPVTLSARTCNTQDCNFDYAFTRTVSVSGSMDTYQVDFTWDKPSTTVQAFIRVGGNFTPITIDNIKVGAGQLNYPTPTGCQLNILPIGDSITQGGSGSNEWTGGATIMYGSTYRQELYYQLKALGYDVNMIGTMQTVAQSVDDNPFGGPAHINGDENTVGGWDSDCEAYWGDTTSDLVGYLTSNSSQWEAIPDIALIHIGTNNLLNSTTQNTADYKAIVAHLRTVNPKIKIYIAKLISIWEKAQEVGGPIVTLDQATKVAEYNSIVVPAVAAESTTESPIYVVDQSNTLTYPTFTENGGNLTITNRSDFEDPFHPTPEGAVKMADKWLEAILANMPF